MPDDKSPATPEHPPSTVEVTSIKAIGDDKVAITLTMEVDVHRTVEVGGEMLSVAIKEVNSHTPNTSPDKMASETSAGLKAVQDPKTLRTG